MTFEEWYEQEGKDMLPIKESLEVAWKTAAYNKEESLVLRCIEKTDGNGHLTHFPQLGLLKPNTKIEILSREIL